MSTTYSPNDWALNLGGFNIDFEEITDVSPDADAVKFTRGVRGEIVMNVSRADPLIKIKIATLQSNQANTILDALYESVVNGLPGVPGSLVAYNGGAGFMIPKGALVRKPGPKVGGEVGKPEWEFAGGGKIHQAGAII